MQTGPSKGLAMPIEHVEAIFDTRNVNWSRTYGNNRLFLQAQRAYANVLLTDRGFLTLNEVFGLLSLPPTEEGALAGWVGDTIAVDFGEEADIPPTDKSSIKLLFNINSHNVFHDKQ